MSEWVRVCVCGCVCVCVCVWCVCVCVCVCVCEREREREREREMGHDMMKRGQSKTKQIHYSITVPVQKDFCSGNKRSKTYNSPCCHSKEYSEYSE